MTETEVETETQRRRKPKSLPLWGRAEFTTGQCARIAGVAPRTVSKWFDSGVLKGYRFPDSQDRRVPAGELVRFMLAQGMRHRLELSGFCLDPVAVGVECAVPGELPPGWSRRRCDYATGLLAAASDPNARLVLVHAGVGLAMAREFAAAVRDRRAATCAPLTLVYVAAPDHWPATTPTGFDAEVADPIDPAQLWALVAPIGGV